MWLQCITFVTEIAFGGNLAYDLGSSKASTKSLKSASSRQGLCTRSYWRTRESREIRSFFFHRSHNLVCGWKKDYLHIPHDEISSGLNSLIWNGQPLDRQLSSHCRLVQRLRFSFRRDRPFITLGGLQPYLVCIGARIEPCATLHFTDSPFLCLKS